MIRYILSLSVTFSLALAVSGQIENGDFESFVDHIAYEDLIGLETSNIQDYLLNVSPSVNKVSGLDGFAARLTGQKLFGSFNFPGMVGTQNLLFDDQERMPYTDQPDSAYIVVRYNIAPGDTAGVVFDFYNDDMFVKRERIKVFGQSDNFIEISFDFSDFAGPTDELFWTVTSSELASTNLDSWLEIDEIRLTGVTDQLPNNLFNDWESKGWTSPESWQSSNLLTDPLIGIAGVAQSETSQSGESAVSLTSVASDMIGFVGTKASLITSGDLRSLVDGGEGISIAGAFDVQNSNAIIGYYQFDSNDKDGAAIRVQLQDADNGVISDELMDLSPNASYTKFTYVFPNEADQAVVTFISGIDVETGDYSTLGGSELLVDNIALDIVSSTKGDFGDQGLNFEAFINNQDGSLAISFSESIDQGIVAFYDIKGTMIFEDALIKTNQYSRSIAQLNSGIYVLQLTSENKRGSIKLYVH